MSPGGGSREPRGGPCEPGVGGPCCPSRGARASSRRQSMALVPLPQPFYPCRAWARAGTDLLSGRCCPQPPSRAGWGLGAQAPQGPLGPPWVWGGRTSKQGR